MDIGSYELDLDVDFRKAHVDGLVTVHVERGEKPFVLDAVDLEIKGVEVNGAAAVFRHDKKAGSLKVEGVPAGKSTVRVTYSKDVSDDVIFGLYKSKYGKEYFLVTDLEPAEARTVFPCKDHPAAKAVFELAITTQKGLTVISNSPVAAKWSKGATTRFEFEPTPRMSTYLLFFGIGNFEEIGKLEHGKEVIVASRPKESANGRFVLDVASSVLSYYQQYFGVPYPLRKLHMVALPEYHTGAMENWGAITSREAYVLLGEGSSVSDRQGGALVMAHEIAHQWFGDLVTMKWWDDLWLNESFATFMECKSIGKLHPDWDPWAFFLRTQTFRSQAIDALSTTHPIQVRVRTPAEAGQVFDAISYGKGASVLRMIESFIGEDAFCKGVSSYLKRFSYSNATGEDLWKSLQKASGQPVSRIMGQWIKMPGFPLVSVSYRGGKLFFTQRRFQLNGEAPRAVWPIPLTFEVNGERKTALFDKPELSVDAPKLRSLSVNLDHAGYYSVLYSPELRELVARGFGRLSPYDRGGFMNDMYLFLLAGKVEPQAYYRFVSLCTHERHSLIVETVADHLSALFSIANESPGLMKRVNEFAVAQAERLGFSPRRGEAPRDSVTRESIASLLARLDTKFTEELAAMFEKYDEVDPSVKEAAAIAYARIHGKGAFEPLVELAMSAKSEVDRSRIYSALTSFEDPKLVERTLELGISGKVSRSDSAYTLTRAAANPHARNVLWRWLKVRYDRLWAIYAGSQQILLYYEGAVPRCAVGRTDEVKEFFSGAMMKQGGMAFRRIIESVEIRTKLREKLLAN